MRMILRRAIDRSAADATMSEYRGSCTVSRSTVLLQHNVPDGSQHFDWLLDVADAPHSPLTTFRLPSEIDAMPPGSRMRALRIADHRRLYLEYEGRLSSDRGWVQRIAAGTILELAREAGEWTLLVNWRRDADGDHTTSCQRLLLRCEGDPGRIMQPWVVFCLPSNPDSP